ncbi:MAG: hypothetical protein MJ237_03350 [bacterium]|nr:hypothetical protein [bacterium]
MIKDEKGSNKLSANVGAFGEISTRSDESSRFYSDARVYFSIDPNSRPPKMPSTESYSVNDNKTVFAGAKAGLCYNPTPNVKIEAGVKGGYISGNGSFNDETTTITVNNSSTSEDPWVGGYAGEHSDNWMPPTANHATTIVDKREISATYKWNNCGITPYGEVEVKCDRIGLGAAVDKNSISAGLNIYL